MELELAVFFKNVPKFLALSGLDSADKDQTGGDDGCFELYVSLASHKTPSEPPAKIPWSAIKPR